ncbi:MAG: 30S ribosomal protein S2, partial [bacterium]
MILPTLQELLESGVHFGHQKGRWHPKMKPFIYAERNGIHVLNLEKTAVKLAEAAEFVKGVSKRGGSVLFVGTKKQAQNIMKKYALESGSPYIIERWIGGLFTNFTNVSKLIKKYKGLLESKESGALEKYTKKEQVEFAKEIEKLSRFVGGLTDLNKIPEAIFVCYVKKEKTAVAEATKRNVPIISFVDSNINP